MHMMCEILKLSHFLKDFIYLFLERGEGRERGRETSMCCCLSHIPTPGDLAHNPGTCPDLELNPQPLSSQASAQATEPQQPGQKLSHFKKISLRG